MTDFSWKKWEREFGRILGRQRTGVSGRRDADLLPTSYYDFPIVAECKYRSSQLIQGKDFIQAERNSLFDRLWMIGYKRAKTGDRVVVTTEVVISILWKLAKEGFEKWLQERIQAGEVDLSLAPREVHRNIGRLLVISFGPENERRRIKLSREP